MRSQKSRRHNVLHKGLRSKSLSRNKITGGLTLSRTHLVLGNVVPSTKYVRGQMRACLLQRDNVPRFQCHLAYRVGQAAT